MDNEQDFTYQEPTDIGSGAYLLPSPIAKALEETWKTDMAPLIVAVGSEYFRQELKPIQRQQFLRSLPEPVFDILHKTVTGLQRASQRRRPITDKKPCLYLLHLYIRGNTLEDETLRKESWTALVTIYTAFFTAAKLQPEEERWVWEAQYKHKVPGGDMPKKVALRHLNWVARQLRTARKARTALELA